MMRVLFLLSCFLIGLISVVRSTDPYYIDASVFVDTMAQEKYRKQKGDDVDMEEAIKYMLHDVYLALKSIETTNNWEVKLRVTKIEILEHDLLTGKAETNATEALTELTAWRKDHSEDGDLGDLTIYLSGNEFNFVDGGGNVAVCEPTAIAFGRVNGTSMDFFGVSQLIAYVLGSYGEDKSPQCRAASISDLTVLEPYVPGQKNDLTICNAHAMKKKYDELTVSKNNCLAT